MNSSTPATNAPPPPPRNEQFEIRRATLSDASKLATLGRQTFTETFGYMYTPNDLAAYLDEAYSMSRIEGDLNDDKSAMWIVLRGDDAIGFALTGPAVVPHDDVTSDAIELHRFYLVKTEQGASIGSQMFALVEQWLNANCPNSSNGTDCSDGFEDVWLGVWSENLGAQRFYARAGFEKVGQYKFKVGDHYDDEFIMRRRRVRAQQ